MNLQGLSRLVASGIRLLQACFWTPKDGRKLLLGKKHTTLGLMVSPGSGQKEDRFQDLVNWA